MLALKAARFPFFITWVPHIVLGALLAARYGYFDWFRLALVAAGLFFAMCGCHMFHIALGASSTFPEGLIEEAKLFLYGSGFISLAVVAAVLLTIGRPLVPLFVLLGMAAVLLYGLLHLETLWGLGQAGVSLGVMYVLAGFVTWQAALIVVGIGFLSLVGLRTYRLLTGDYDHIPPGPKRGLAKMIAYYTLGISLVAVGTLVI